MTLLFTTSCFLLLSQTQNLGYPPSKHFDKRSYKGGNQTWEAEKLPNGVLLFANDQGLLEYNGNTWNTYPLPKKTICRSLCIDYKNRIFAGGQDELGYFVPDKTGMLQFESIRNLIDEQYLPLEDVWDMVALHSKVYFRTNERLFIYDKQKIDILPELGTLTFLTEVNGKIFFHVNDKGLFTIEDGQAIFLESTESLKNFSITGIVQTESSYIIGTLRNGLKEYKVGNVSTASTNYNNYLEVHGISSIEKITDDKIAISTLRGGLVVVNNKLKALNLLNKSNSLQNNNVNCMIADQWQNLWIGSTNGIDHIIFSDNSMEFSPDGDQEGSVYAIIEYNNRFYFGTNNGLYHIEKKDYYDPFRELDFRKVKNSDGQVWGLSIIDNDLLVGHNDGAFQLIDNRLEPIFTDLGAWKFIKLPYGRVAIGTYKGILLYEKVRDRYEFYQKIPGFEESSRIMELDDKGLLWVSHPYRGVFRINPYTTSSSAGLNIVKYEVNKGLPSDYQNYVFKINDEIHVTAEKGIYYFDAQNDRFLRESNFSKLIDSTQNVRRLFQYQDGEIWYVAENEIGLFLDGNRVGTQGYFKKSWNNFHNRMVGGFQTLLAKSDDGVFLAVDDGVVNLQYDNNRRNDSLYCHISSIAVVENDKISVHHGYYIDNKGNVNFSEQPNEDITELAPHQNAIRFNFASNYLSDDESVQYQYILEGTDDDWSPWNPQQEKEYTNLTYGKYTFKVKARKGNNESNTALYTFHLKPYWYQTAFAKILYALAGIGLLWLFLFLNGKRYTKEADQLKLEQEKSLEKIKELKTEKLQAEISFRDKELASTTMHLVQKSETITKLKSELESLNKQLSDKDLKKNVRKILTIINDDRRVENDWENFAFFFDQVHTNFLQRLQMDFPVLTSKDLKLAAYLRLGLSTKEIAPMMNISVRGVEISRYRLRKKLELENEINLNEFMLSY